MSHEFVVGRLYIQKDYCVYLQVGAEHFWLFSYPCVFNNVYQLAIVETSGQHNPLVFLDDPWYRFCQVYTYELCQCWCVCGIFNIMFGSLDICRVVCTAVSFQLLDWYLTIVSIEYQPYIELRLLQLQNCHAFHTCSQVSYIVASVCSSTPASPKHRYNAFRTRHPALLSEVAATFALPAWTCSGTRM